MSCKPRSDDKSIRLSNETTKSLTIDFTNEKPLFIAVLNPGETYPLEQQEKVNSIRNYEVAVFHATNFTRPFSLDLFISTNSTSNQPDKLGQVTFSHEQEEHSAESDEDDVRHSVCFSSDKFRITRGKINSSIDYRETTTESLHCVSHLSSLSEVSALHLNINHTSLSGELTKSVYIASNPKLKLTHRLILMTQNDLLADISGLIGLNRFVKFTLKNPTVISGSYLGPDSILDTWSGGAVAFKSDFEFSEETTQFIKESCKATFYRDENITLSLATGREVKRMFRTSKELKSFWNGSVCPVQTGIEMEIEEMPINVEFFMTNQPNRTERVVDVLLHPRQISLLKRTDILQRAISNSEKEPKTPSNSSKAIPKNLPSDQTTIGMSRQEDEPQHKSDFEKTMPSLATTFKIPRSTKGLTTASPITSRLTTAKPQSPADYLSNFFNRNPMPIWYGNDGFQMPQVFVINANISGDFKFSPNFSQKPH